MTDQPIRRQAGSEATSKEDLVSWLTAQLDHDEQVARSGSKAMGLDDPGYPDYQTYVDDDTRSPARVLRQVAAHRAILVRHKPVPGEEHIVCDIDSFVGHDDTECLYGDPYPCADVRALASIYSDHPGFDPSWRVE